MEFDVHYGNLIGMCIPIVEISTEFDVSIMEISLEFYSDKGVDILILVLVFWCIIGFYMQIILKHLLCNKFYIAM